MPSHRPRSLVWTALLACALALLLCSVSAARTTGGARVASEGSPQPHRGPQPPRSTTAAASTSAPSSAGTVGGTSSMATTRFGSKLTAGASMRISPITLMVGRNAEVLASGTRGTSLLPLARALPPSSTAASSGAPATAGSSRMPAVMSLGTRLALTVQPRERRHSSSGGSTVLKTAEHRMRRLSPS